MRDLLGGKGAGLMEMTRLSFPVPPGFTISTDACRHWLNRGTHPTGLSVEIGKAVSWLEDITGRRISCAANPLLVSVRSGAPISMPGMMDTILNVGFNDDIVEAFGVSSGSRRFALDSYRRLIQMFGTVVLNIPSQAFQRELAEARTNLDLTRDSDFSEEALSELIGVFKQIVLSHTGSPFPQDPHQQLMMAVNAVFASWLSARAKYYRKLNQISESLATAVTVQAMVFGNCGEDSGTGVGFTRNPSTGERQIFGEFLPNAQGEDIVAGAQTPMPITELANRLPDSYEELLTLAERLENHYRDVQDFEFTIERGKLFLLQTRTAKRTALAAVRIAVGMAEESLISQREAVSRIKPESISEILTSQLDLSTGDPTPLTEGLAASPGAAVGQIALSPPEAVDMVSEGKAVILVTDETTADDIHGMAVAAGFLTARGGATSHAAVVARGMGKCCITGAKHIELYEEPGKVRIGSSVFQTGDWLSIDGTTGRVFKGKLPLHPASSENPHLNILLKWATSLSSCAVRANADTPADGARARKAHADGIGLCRTEHMFFAPERLTHVRSMILAEDTADRVEQLEILLPMQQQDFEELFRVMSPLPVTIRLLDPPLHEFLPSKEEIDLELKNARREEDWSRAMKLEALARRWSNLREVNPMMGHRGCRLSLTFPEMLQMQVEAVLQAALSMLKEGYSPSPEIMVPFISSEEEMAVIIDMIHDAASKVFEKQQSSIEYEVGTMIELPRAAVCAGRIAKHVSFVSFGTNDLTQMTYGFSRDDSKKYLDLYLEKGILRNDPFITIDREGVGSLMDLAISQIRAVNPKIKIGVCGEHGGDPESIKFFHSIGVDYVSCSPARLAVAQLAVAQTELLLAREKTNNLTAMRLPVEESAQSFA